jgi:hypothetical protein
MMCGLCSCGRLCVGSSRVGIMVGCCVVILSSYNHSRVESRACKVWSSCGVVASAYVCFLKSLTVCIPKSMLKIGHLPPLWLSNIPWRSLNVLLCLDVFLTLSRVFAIS